MSTENKMKKVLVLGASGATGRLLVNQLLDQGCQVSAVVRPQTQLPEQLTAQENLIIVRRTLLEMSDQELSDLVVGCDGIASCLGHNLSFKGVYGKPRKLVTDAVMRLSQAVEANKPSLPVKFVLMNSTGNRNRGRLEPVSFAQRCVVFLIRYLVPPHADNEQAAEYLRRSYDTNHSQLQWVAVRPDSLIDESETSAYQVHVSPIRSAIFDSGQTSRINVAHFMAQLMLDNKLWDKWRGEMPVIYND